MKKLLFLLLLCFSYANATTKNEIITLCMEDGYSKSNCLYSYDYTMTKFDRQLIDRTEASIDFMDQSSVEYYSSIELLNDWNMVFEDKLIKTKQIENRLIKLNWMEY